MTNQQKFEKILPKYIYHFRRVYGRHLDVSIEYKNRRVRFGDGLILTVAEFDKALSSLTQARTFTIFHRWQRRIINECIVIKHRLLIIFK